MFFCQLRITKWFYLKKLYNIYRVFVVFAEFWKCITGLNHPIPAGTFFLPFLNQLLPNKSINTSEVQNTSFSVHYLKIILYFFIQFFVYSLLLTMSQGSNKEFQRLKTEMGCSVIKQLVSLDIGRIVSKSLSYSNRCE